MEEINRLQMFWLGTPRIVMNGKPVKFETRKAMALLVYLSQESRSITREALAEPESYLRVFIDLGEPARDLLNVYLCSASPGHKEYAQKILDVFSG